MQAVTAGPWTLELLVHVMLNEQQGLPVFDGSLRMTWQRQHPWADPGVVAYPFNTIKQPVLRLGALVHTLAASKPMM
jgi:hypothetical protein